MKPLNKIRIDGHIIIQYTCGCKSCLSGKAKRMIFDVGYNQESQTYRILKEVQAGSYGDDWKKLLTEYPSGTVDIHAELFVCPICGMWKNDYNMSFYTLEKGFVTNTKSVFLLDGYSVPEYDDVVSGIQSLIDKYQNHYQLFKEYSHKCPSCDTQMVRIPLRKDLWIDISKLEELRLRCPHCKQTIQICR